MSPSDQAPARDNETFRSDERGLDPRRFRRALGQFATGIAVITAQEESGTPIGLTMSSFNSVSLDPPLVLFSVDRRAFSLDAMLKAEGYAVNILSRSQDQISNRFATPLTDKWSDVAHTPGLFRAPLLADALAHFECAPYATYDGGDHVIFVGRVLRCAANPGHEPLVFFRGAYRSLSAIEQAPEWPLPIHY